MGAYIWREMIMMKNCWQPICGFLLFFSTTGLRADEPAVHLVPLDAWTTTFGDLESKLRFAVKADADFEGVLRWRHAFGNRTLRSGETAVRVTAGQSSAVSVPLWIGPVKEGVILETRLSVYLTKTGAGQPLVEQTRRITIYPENAFYQRSHWLKDLEIQVFDPPGQTVERLQSAGVPFSRIQNTAILDGLSKGLLIVGEGTSFRQHRQLPERLEEIASRGMPVLCLAPTAGEIPFPTANTDPKPRRVSLMDEAVIHKIDKRLDDRQWQTVNLIAPNRFKIQVRRGRVFVEVGDDGWPWLEIEYAKKSRLVYCGFALIENWDAGPTPRFLLLRLIEGLTGDSRSEASH